MSSCDEQPFACYENLVIAHSSIENMAIVYDHEAICRLQGKDKEDAKRVLDMIAKSMQLAAIPEHTNTAEMYAQLTHEEMDHPLALKTRDSVRYQAMRAIRDDLREHGATYEADVRECVAMAMNAPEAAVEQRIDNELHALALEMGQQFAAIFAAQGVLTDLERRRITDREAYLPSQIIVEKAHDRILEITKQEERIIRYRRNLDLVEKFKKIVQ
jgi:uncharacterized protein with PIN domain